MAAETQPLISVAELSELIDDPRLVLLDVRWSLGQTDGRERYLGGHIPGARYIDLDRDLAAAPSPAQGRHPLPRTDDLQRALRALGVHGDSTVVAYDQSQGVSAARLWWLLRNAGFASTAADDGHGSVRVLDGGLDAWARTGRELSVGNPITAMPGTVSITMGAVPTITIDEAASFADHGLLLDARAGERYRGEIEPIDPRAGHIPGAISAPTSENLDGVGAFLPTQQLRERFAQLGVQDGAPTAVYCGSGVTAAHQILALEAAGYEAALFPGSWSQWSEDSTRPAATGEKP